VAKFYGLVSGDFYAEGESGKQDFAGSIGLLRYIIAHGDTSVQRYRSFIDSKQVASPQDLEEIERNKYLIYAQFDEYLSRSKASESASEVIEMDWDQIEALESSDTAASKAHADLGESWEIVDTTEAPAPQASATVDHTLLTKHADITTVLFDTELRQVLMDDLEEVESFLR